MGSGLFTLPCTGDKINLVGMDYSSGQDVTAEVEVEADKFGRITVVDVRYFPSTPPRDGVEWGHDPKQATVCKYGLSGAGFDWE